MSIHQEIAEKINVALSIAAVTEKYRDALNTQLQVQRAVDKAKMAVQAHRQECMLRLEQYREAVTLNTDFMSRHTIAHSGGVSGPQAKVAISADVSDDSSIGEGASSAGGSDDEGGDGDGDGDGPRRRSTPVSSNRSASKSRSSYRAVRRRLKPKHSPDVIMHTRALLTLVLIFVLCICGAAGFALLGHEGLALTCLGLAAVDGGALAGKLVTPK
ncbi:hypothetical protein GTP44_25305 [Duganella sp. FT50W]|uniref:Uncharacterized protein n=1 Tax=Duganella lactea TaxID=2692173 RepID=A0A6L8MT59_9BURK|nr:hypothetical protein [Duganella lactea]MYM85243.1 hypothetical protein [Duganella lactea]